MARTLCCCPSQNQNVHSARSQPMSLLSKPAFSSWCQPNSPPLLVRDSQNLCGFCSPGGGGNPAAHSPARACEGQRGEQRARPCAPRPSTVPPPSTWTAGAQPPRNRKMPNTERQQGQTGGQADSGQGPQSRLGNKGSPAPDINKRAWRKLSPGPGLSLSETLPDFSPLNSAWQKGSEEGHFVLLLAKRTSKRATSPACGLLIQGKAARSQPCPKTSK